MRTAQQKQIIAHQNKLNKILRSRDTAMGKVGAVMDILLQLKQDSEKVSANTSIDTATAKAILTSRMISRIK